MIILLKLFIYTMDITELRKFNYLIPLTLELQNRWKGLNIKYKI